MYPEPVESEIDQHLRWPNLAAKAALVSLLMLGVIAGEWEQFQGKAMLILPHWRTVLKLSVKELSRIALY